MGRPTNPPPDNPANDKNRSEVTQLNRDAAEILRTVGDAHVKIDNIEGAAEAYQAADEHDQIANDRDGMDKKI